MRLTALTASLFALSIAAAMPSYAESTQQPVTHTATETQNSILISNPWSRELPPTAPVGAVFLSIDNHSDQPERFLSAHSSIAAVTELHAHIHEGDVMRMVKVEGIDIPAHSNLTLEPGGYHVMLIDLKKPLIAGEQLPLTLQFEHAGQIDVIVDIKSSDAGTSAATQPMDHSQHNQH